MADGGRFAALVVEDGTEAVARGVLQLAGGMHVLTAGLGGVTVHVWINEIEGSASDDC